MSAWILALPLLAAALHATWNALLKTAADRMITLGFFSFVNVIVGLVLLMFFDPPDSSSWGLIALSAVVKYGYYVLIYFAYRVGDLSLVYPLARGSAPLVVALGAAVFAGEYLSTPAQVGVVIACLGISSLAAGSLGKLQGSLLPVVLALGTGVTIAIYTICDGLGVRVSGSVFGFIGAIYVLEFPVVLAVVWLRRQHLAVAIGSHWRYGLTVGICGAAGYGLVVYSALFVPLSIVSALRETSVIMAALIGTVMLGERPWQDRVAASSLVAGGVALMTVYR
jgi:drug/metabolite transporter (DMT)-like permease